MNKLQLIIGNKTFSSNSLRSWLLLKEFGVDFEEIKIELYRDNTAEKLGLYSPSLKVPVLRHEEMTIWDSLAICEYISESFLEGRGWPGNIKKKAAARSVSAEIHSGFENLAREWPMNCCLKVNMKPTEVIEEEIARLDAIMYCCRRKYGDGGSYLFGDFSIADCFLAPHAIALKAYGAELSWKSQRYVDHLLENPHLQWWIDDAVEEHKQLPWCKTG